MNTVWVRREMTPDLAAVMAACRLWLSPRDPEAFAMLLNAAGVMEAVPGESPAREAFRMAAKAYVAARDRDRLDRLRVTMTEFNKELLRDGSVDRPLWRRGGNRVAAALPPQDRD